LFSEIRITRIYDEYGEFVNQTLSRSAIQLKIPAPNQRKNIPFDVFEIPQGSVVFHPNGPMSYHVVYDNDSRVIEPASGGLRLYSSTMEKRDHSMKHHTIQGNLMILHYGCHYWHFHFETVSQLNLFSQAKIFEKYRDQENHAMSHGPCKDKIYFDILDFFGFHEPLKTWHHTKIDSTALYRVSVTGTLVVTTITFAAGYLPYESNSRFLNQKAMENLHNSRHFRPTDPDDVSYFHRRIFIGREDKGNRGIANMHDVENIFHKYDIYVFNPGVNSTYAKQMFMFSHAELVIGVSGTGFSANIPFCHANNTVMIEIITPKPATGTGRMVATALGAKYYANFTGTYNASDNTKNAQFYLNTTMLDRILFSELSQLDRR
jgi:hypothetical protein